MWLRREDHAPSLQGAALSVCFKSALDRPTHPSVGVAAS